MKKIIYTLWAITLFFMSSISLVSAQSENRSISGFNAISSEGPFEVYLKIDGTESLKILASADIIPLIVTKVEHGVLRVKFQDNLKNGQGNTSEKIKIYIEAKNINSLVKIGSGSIKVDGVLDNNNLSIVVNGSGNIQSSVKSKNLKASITGSGSINMDGTAGLLYIKIDGPGDIKGDNLKTDDASVIINGSGSVDCFVEKAISSHVTGSGRVIYSGSPAVTSGSSGLVKKV